MKAEVPPDKQCTTRNGVSGKCLNPVCGVLLESPEEGTWRRTPRMYCCDVCKGEASILRRAGKLLADYGMAKAWEVLTRLDQGMGNPGQ